jgi:DNA modification methylase
VTDLLGSAARFFYCAKASKRDRDEGLDCIEIITIFAVWEKEEKIARLLVNMDTLQPKVTVEYTAKNKNGLEWSTLLFGKIFTEQFHSECKSITSTASNLITESKTLNVLAHYITKGYIAGVNLEQTDGGSHAENAAKSSTLILTTNEKTALALGVENAVLPTQLKINASAGQNIHSTVKPTDLMRYLCRLVTPPNGTVLDPFMGSGSTGKAAALEGFSFIGIEREAEYVTIAQARINHVTND